MWLFKHYLAVPIELVIKAHVVLPAETAKTQERCLTSYSAIVNSLLKRYATDDNIVAFDADI